MPSFVDLGQTLAHLEEAERHVREGELRIERLLALVAEQERAGYPTDQARSLLRQFKRSQAAHVAHRNRLREEARQGQAPEDD